MPNTWHSSLVSTAANLKNRALNLFLKQNCPLCDRTAIDICCQYCQRQIQECQLADPARYWYGELPLFAWGKYTGSIKRSMGKLKYDGHRSIAYLYGELLADSWQKSQPSIDNLIVIPIPLHADKLASRGFNQAELIARKFCQVTGAKLDLSLQRTRSTVAQFGLSKSARQENVAGAFALVRSSLKSGANILLIDDIYTTGSTVRSVASVLRSHQLDVCGVAVVATGRDD
ncbi:ComF family protein [Chamaesiphon sp.]|uniref:ComF family protein n=1 Tax=Chamaesiphon sp. TaxID=2814140 RepID=UPI0035933336